MFGINRCVYCHKLKKTQYKKIKFGSRFFGMQLCKSCYNLIN